MVTSRSRARTFPSCPPSMCNASTPVRTKERPAGCATRTGWWATVDGRRRRLVHVRWAATDCVRTSITVRSTIASRLWWSRCNARTRIGWCRCSKWPTADILWDTMKLAASELSFHWYFSLINITTTKHLNSHSQIVGDLFATTSKESPFNANRDSTRLTAGIPVFNRQSRTFAGNSFGLIAGSRRRLFRRLR